MQLLDKLPIACSNPFEPITAGDQNVLTPVFNSYEYTASATCYCLGHKEHSHG